MRAAGPRPEAPKEPQQQVELVRGLWDHPAPESADGTGNVMPFAPAAPPSAAGARQPATAS